MSGLAANGAQAARTALLSLAIAAAGSTSPVVAQEMPPRERTGPLAQPLPPPDYAVPPSDAPLLPEPQPYRVEPRPAGIRFAQVVVTTEGEGRALPQPGWEPAPDPVTGLTLSRPGMDGFDAAWVEQQFRANGLIGQPIGYDRVLALLQLINRAMLANGYANSGVLVAPRDPGSDTLALRLVNGRIGAADGSDGIAVRFADDRACGLTSRYVAQRMPSAQARPFSAYALERDFRLLAADPAIRTVDASLRPGSRPGEATLDLLVAPDCALDVYALVANDRSPAVGGLRGAIGGSKRSAMIAGDILAGEASYSDGLTDGFVSYSGPVFGPATRLLLRGAINDAAVVEPRFAALDITSEEWSVEGGISHTIIDTPLIPSGAGWDSARSLSAGALVVHRRTETELLGLPFSFSPGAVDGRAEYTALRLTQDFVERGTRHVFAVSLTETIGLEGTRPTAPGSLKVNENFTAILAQATYARRIGEGLDVNLRIAGQYSGGTLYSGERFSLGGHNSVRGYRENLILADRALFGSAELGYNLSLTGAARDADSFDWGAFRLSAFVDGALADNDRAPEPLPEEIAAVGASLAWQPSDAILARVTYAEALKDAGRIGKQTLQDKGFQFFVTVRPLKLFQ
ncbi:ShlB/FhaC/HecB family hemolysin secretion/activation protein [Novosphingobium aquimarinum]|uniref:ShlB/FhaC/HecB family hemolysin secretion/activation protein n=1 Tax=Novosphingobium aquimarinum TaxID=2682494 RepID=UPI0012EBD486|nr:ShlB/FhaC/HecB family hemolysin secretion/activation protein [Novosphingobium aquimarinum]